MGRRQSSWPCPYDRNFFVCRRSSLKGVIINIHQDIGCITLQKTNLNRLTFRCFSNACFFAQSFRGADPRTHTSQYILIQYRFRRGNRHPGRYLSYKKRNINIGWACSNARSIITKITSVCCNCRLMAI